MRKYLGLFKKTFQEFGDDKAPRLGAALAYYTMFSVGPLLLIAVSMAGFFLGKEAARGEISAELGKVFGPQMSQSLEQMIEAAAKPKSGTLATIIGVVTLLIGASGVFGQLKDALNTIWNVEPQKGGGWKRMVKERFLSMAMVLGIGFLLLVTLIADTAVVAMGGYIGRVLPGGAVAAELLQMLLSFGIAVVLFAAIFHFLPDLKVAWRDVWFGAAFTAALFVLGKFGLGLYLGRATVSSPYGAAGSLVILLIWVYWSAQILFFGAEFTQVYARTHGSMAGDTTKDEARAHADRPEDRRREVTTPEGVPVPAPATAAGYAAAYAKAPAKRGGGAVKVAAAGFAGLLFGAIAGGISAVFVVLKSVRKVFVPFK